MADRQRAGRVAPQGATPQQAPPERGPGLRRQQWGWRQSCSVNPAHCTTGACTAGCTGADACFWACTACTACWLPTLGDATAPSAARIREVQDQITATGAVCAFPEATQPTRLIEDLTAGTNLRIGEALSPEGTELDIGAGLYGALLDQMGQRIATCLTASPQ